MQEQKSWLQRIQESDEDKKKVYLIATSAVAMVVVVVLWAGYLNATIHSAFSPAKPQQADNNVSFSDTVKGGTATIYHAFIDWIKGTSQAISTPKDYMVSPQGN